jgi:carbonic anhydrase
MSSFNRFAVLLVASAVSASACSAPAERPAEPSAALATPAATTPPQPTTKPSVTPAAGDPVWHYEGAEGPERWGALSPKFAACGEGRAQSPIDIGDATPAANSPTLTMRFPTAALKIAHHEHVADGINNGHTIQINYEGGDTMTIAGEAYALVQYHFHDPSEHTIKGKHFPMEMHLVHKSASGRLAVIGVLIEEGAHNAAFDPIWSNLPSKKGVETHYQHVNVDVDALLPTKRSSYRYDGSLTTPPCSEGVRWVVMTTPIQLSADQIRAFTAIIRDNNRPTQPLNGRAIATEPVVVAAR